MPVRQKPRTLRDVAKVRQELLAIEQALMTKEVDRLLKLAEVAGVVLSEIPDAEFEAMFRAYAKKADSAGKPAVPERGPPAHSKAARKAEAVGG